MGRLYAYAADKFTQNLSSPLSLYMSFSDEFEVAMITIDEATAILEITHSDDIALPF